MKFKTEPLDLLKVIIHQENLGENRAAAAADDLCAVHLQTDTNSFTTLRLKYLWHLKEQSLRHLTSTSGGSKFL